MTRPHPGDRHDCQAIADWLFKAMEAMRLPPAEVSVKASKVKRGEEAFTAEIEIEPSYHLIRVNVDLTRFRAKTVTQQKLCLTHELGHYVEHMFDEAVDGYVAALKLLIPPCLLKQDHIDKLEAAMNSEGEKMTDHIAFLALPRVPEWKGIK